ncbi:MAG: serine hydrolase domain-containing protein [Steroidobacterales bacterium]
MPRGTLKLLIGSAVLAVLVALLAHEGGPLFWKRYAASQVLPATAIERLYQPRELVAGGNEPPAPRVAPEQESLDPQSLEMAAAYAQAHRSRAFIVSRHDHIVFERYGQGATFDTVTDAPLFPRVLAALAVGIAISHRVVGWPDEPLGTLLPEWRGDPRGAITVRNLLQMSSGLRPPEPTAVPWGEFARQRFGTDFTAALMSEPLKGTPGATRVEQAADPQLLALALERATGQRYAAYLSSALWRRLGAADAWVWLDRPGGTAHADCCMLVHQGDWIRVGQLLVRDGNYRGSEVIRPGWVSLMRTPAKSDSDYGAYVRVGARIAGGAEPYAAKDLYVVDGGGGSRLWLVPSLGLAVLRIATPGAKDPSWDDTRIPNLVVRAARDYLPPAAQPGADVSAIVPGH